MSLEQKGPSPIFTSQERATIEAATARIIPTDRDPGALEAGIINYIENTLSSYDAQAYRLYLDGIKELDKLAQLQFGADLFCSLQPGQQDQVLSSLEAKGSPFFAKLVEDTMEGFYGDPRHGGNKNRVGWTILGFPGPSYPVGYQSPLGWYDAYVPDEFAQPKKKNA